MRFSRVLLENWRNFRRVDVPLQNRVFLVGPNASGKSNFLDAFRFLRDLVSPGGGFQALVTSRGGESHIRNLAARRHPQIVVQVEMEEKGKLAWRYQLAFAQDNQGRPVLKGESVWRGEEQILERPNEEDRADEDRLRQTYLEQTFANREFREIARFFSSIRYYHIVPQLVRDPERLRRRESDLFDPFPIFRSFCRHYGGIGSIDRARSS
ncbi:MAG TPA: hypothetical protein ENJ31_11870 [Anaerolineae bacterium]|nr:hypothetical protein [Anaerolineae bacterium]